MQTKLQIPVDNQTKIQANDRAQKDGFSSIQEVVRVFLSNYAKGNFSINFNTNSEHTSDKYEEFLNKRLKEILEDFKMGKTYSVTSGQGLIDLIN